jgi:hypothetical protein
MITLTITGIQQDLKDGLTRKAIAEKYGISQTELKIHMKHPKLKGRKTIKPKVMISELQDDTQDSVERETPSQTPESELEPTEIGNPVSNEEVDDNSEMVEADSSSPWAN